MASVNVAMVLAPLQAARPSLWLVCHFTWKQKNIELWVTRLCKMRVSFFLNYLQGFAWLPAFAGTHVFGWEIYLSVFHVMKSGYFTYRMNSMPTVAGGRQCQVHWFLQEQWSQAIPNVLAHYKMKMKCLMCQEQSNSPPQQQYHSSGSLFSGFQSSPSFCKR